MISKQYIFEFDIEEEIFLKTDEYQLKRIICAHVIYKSSILYRCACGTLVSDHYAFEMSKEKDYKQVSP
jgi:hypothetical protein